MKVGIWTILFCLVFARFGWGQTGNSSVVGVDKTNADSSPLTYVVFGGTADQEASLRSQIRVMDPEVYPLRILFVPHWKYLDAARTFRLHVPTGFTSVMFTHLPSRTVFIDNDRYLGTDWLGYWVAHELGHLASNSPWEEDAEKAAHQFRRHLKDAHKQHLLCSRSHRHLLTCSASPIPPAPFAATIS